MAETESANIKARVGIDITDAEAKLETFRKKLNKLKKELESQKLTGNITKGLEDTITKLQSYVTQVGRVVNTEKDIKNLSRTLNGAFVGIDGKAKNAAEHVAQIASNWKRISKQMQAVSVQTAGLDALYAQLVYKGQTLRQMFGTDSGKAYMANKLETKGFSMEAAVKNYDSERVRQYELNKARKTAEKQAYTNWYESLSENEKKAEDARVKMERLNNTLGTTQLQVMANYTVINKLTNAFKGLINYTIQYDEELHQLQAISAMSNASLAKTRETIESVAVSTEFTSLELAKASTVLAQAGLSATQIQGTLPAIAKLATATGTDLATSTDVITSTMNIYNLQMSEAEHVTNALTTAMNESKATIPGFQTAIQYAGNTAAQLGMSVEETTAAISAATQAGIRSKSMLGTGLRAVLTEFLKPTKKLIDQLQKVGLTVEDIDVKTKGYVNVLKTLKQAGFGVEEAYRGMERRGAAFLVSQINQTDFMDNLRMKMASSTAASKANETQMEALAKQIKNFQNVLGTAATTGLEPFIKVMSNLLKIINAISQTNLGGGLYSLLTVGVGSMAAVKSWQLLGNSFKGLATGLGLLTSGSKINKLRELVSIGYKEYTGWEKLSFHFSSFFKNLTAGGWVGLVTAVISLIYQLAKAMGVLTTEAEKVQQKLEEAKGALEDTKTERQTINDFINGLIKDREKLKDPVEFKIRVAEILQKLPRAADYIDSTTNSVDQLREALYKLNDTNLEKIGKETREVYNATKASVLANGSDEIVNSLGIRFNREEKRDFLAAYRRLQKTGDTTLSFGDFMEDIRHSGRTRNLNEVYEGGSDKQILDAMKFPTRSALSEVAKNLIDTALANPLLKTNQDIAYHFKSMAADRDLKALAPLLNKIADAFSEASKSLETTADFLVNKEFSKDIERVTTQLTDSVDRVRKEAKAFSFYDEATPMPQDAVKNAEALYKQLSEDYQRVEGMTKAQDYADIGRVLGLDANQVQDIKNNTDGLKQLTPQQFIDAWNRDFIDKGAEISSEILEEMGVIEQILAKQGIIAPGMSNFSAAEEILKNNIKNLKNSENAGKAKESKEKAVKANEALLEINQNLEKEGALFPGMAQLKYKQYEKTITDTFKTLDNRFNRLGAKIDPLDNEFKTFFNNLDTSIKKIMTTYREAEKVLDQALAKQQGITEATNRFYGSGSVMAQAAAIEERKLQESQLGARTANLISQKASLDKELAKMRENPLFAKANDYLETQKKYEAALASGDAQNTLIYQNRLNKATANEKKMATKYDDLIKSINELDETIQKNTTILDQLKAMGNKPIGEQVTGGMSAAATVYRDSLENQGLTTLAGSTAYLTSGVLDSIDSGFTTMFQNIISNSKRAGDAFKDFGRQVLETIRDIAIQMAVKQGISALLGSFMTPTTGGDITGNNLQYGQSSGNLTFLGTIAKASGGLVKGPVPNRDSVNARLMPGEYVLKKSAVDVIGRDYLDSLNSNASATLAATADTYNNSVEPSNTDKGTGGTVNVYVVGQEQQQAMTPSDVLVTITQDMLTGGQTKRLVKSIAMGAL